MKLNEYQMLSGRTRGKFNDRIEELKACSMGIGGESGEVVDVMKKVAYHGHPLDNSKLAYELGDLMFYISWMADALGYTLEEICTLNIEKLYKRYPDGFSREASMNREEYKGVVIDEKI